MFIILYEVLDFEMDLQLHIPSEGKDNVGTVSRTEKMWSVRYSRGKWDSERSE